MARENNPSPSPRRVSLARGDLESLVEESLTREEFLQLCQDDPDSLFEGLVNFATQIVEKERDYQKNIASIEGKLAAKEIQINELCTERDQIADERDRFRIAVANMALSINTSVGPSRQGSVQPEGHHLSEKIPHPPILTDGKHPKFEDWLIEMRNKLTDNADRYNTEAMKRSYLVSRTGGLARQIQNPRLRDDSNKPFNTVQEMYDMLIRAFRNPHRQQEAQSKLRNLRMKIGDNFYEFLAEFLHLAGEAELPESQFKTELDQRMTRKVREMCIAYRSPNKTFDEYAGSVIQSLSEFDEDKRRKNNEYPSRFSNCTDNHDDTTSKSKGSSGGTTEKFSKLDDAARDKLRKENKCFYCREPGHIAPDCPRKPAAKKDNKSDLKALENVGSTEEDSYSENMQS